LIKNVTYRESTSVSRSTELSITADTNYGGQLGPDFAKFANLSRTFGRTEGESVSSSEEKGTDSSGEILPRQWGQWYRQVVKWEEVAVMTGYDECGNEFPVGEVKMITWKYPVMLATGKKCPPPSPFPAAGDCKKDCGNAYTTNEPGASQTGFNTAEGAAQ